MLAQIGPTLETTYVLQLLLDSGEWSWVSGEYTSPDDCHEQASQMYGGAYGRADRHRVVKIERTIA